MKRILVACGIVLVSLVGCVYQLQSPQQRLDGETVELPGFLPKFLQDDEFTCATLAEAVNHFVDMGEEKAIDSLKALADSNLKGDKGYYLRMRLAFTCRALFEPNGKEPLRPPGLGDLSCLPWNPVPLKKWPLYPVVKAGTSYFVLDESYLIAGLSEPALEYVNYCCAEGKFRKDRVPVPTKTQALRDFELLRSTTNWVALKEDNRHGDQYEQSVDRVVEYLRKQAERIPNE